MDVTFQTNFWLGFPESNSDIIINLTHWQYWWWFWFTYLLCLYYFVFLKLIKKRTLKFNPKITTSFRAHGKWGDFIVCLLPISWCLNILSNSNFILRMIEWQTESSLFTVRIRGKQWYWIYKFELKTLLNTSILPKNYGHNYWVLFNLNNVSISDDYLNITQVKFNNEWLDNYTLNVLNRKNLIFSNKVSSLIFLNDTCSSSLSTTRKIFTNKNFLHNSFNLTNNFFLLNGGVNLFTLQPGIKNFSQITTNSYFNNEINHFIRTNTYAKLLPIKLVFNDKHFIVKFQNNSLLNIEKNIIDNLYLVIKQKRFGLNKNISIFNGNYVHLNNLTQFKVTTFNQSNVKLLNLTNGSKNINFSNMHTRRLLRTRRVLVLPTNINVTLITNSFDVVHSWYIPGLGIKLDCIPGRSTHHTLYIDHAGFYYGQCAEICGRYHHHMPIRVCALPYEHFLMWWYHFGLTYFTNISLSKKQTINLNIRQYNW